MRDGLELVVEEELGQHEEKAEGVHAVHSGLDGPAVPGLVWREDEAVHGSTCTTRHLNPVLRIHKILVRIRTRISGSTPPTNGSGCGSGSLTKITGSGSASGSISQRCGSADPDPVIFVSDLQGANKKIIFCF